jgi:lactoylglutathione lyase
MERRVFPIVNCTDLLDARRFYLDVFGAEQVYQFPPEGDPVYVSLQIGDGQVALGLGTGPALYGETPLPASGHAVDICLYVADLDATIRAAEARGAPVPVPPADMPWGERVAYLTDPAGTMLLVIQASDESAPIQADDDAATIQAQDRVDEYDGAGP